jgi:NDP-sugar pyrophosphorylase family protein
MSSKRSHTNQGKEPPLLTASQREGTARRRRSGTANVVVLAGGRGTRLAPYTSILPKPLMPISDRSILEIIIEQLASQQFNDITLCVGYLAHLIRSVLDNRIGEGITLRYVHEGEALGTAGPLRLIENIDKTFVVMNGDVLTTLDYRALVRRHRQSGNALTIATSQRITAMDYGVLHLDGPSLHPSVRRVTAYEEKPQIASLVSMGIYVLEPRALTYIPEGAYFDFPDLVHALLAAGEQVGSYLYDGQWFDIGRREDYELAVEAWTNHSSDGGGANGPDSRSRKRRPTRSTR